MKDKRFWFGICVTTLWLIFSGYMFYTHKRPSELNAWGDSFGGFFAPLAFLWLVIGYMQQGEELKHSTEALRLQADELRNSVEQQSQLVAISREQMKQEHVALQEERELRRDAARPKYVLKQGGSISSGGIVTHHLDIINVGNTATRFRLDFDPQHVSPGSHTLPLVARNEIVKLDLRFFSEESTVARINYLDADGLPGGVSFTLQASSDSGLILGDLE